MSKYQGSPERKALSTLCDNTSNIPVSPTANLRLLTKVASELVSPVPNVTRTSSNVIARESDSKTRKEKSLGILCDRFLAMFPLQLPDDCEVMEICLDRVSDQLGIVKRRIYDIINILESLHMASKVAKNRYRWHGCHNLQSTLSELKAMALDCGVDEKLQDIQAKQKNGFKLVSGPTCCCMKDTDSFTTHFSMDSSGAGEEREHSRSSKGFFSDERTLGVMCLKFIMLFLASPQSSAKINLDLATRMLVSEAAEASEREMWGMKVECHRAVYGDAFKEPCDTGNKSCKCMLRLKTKVRRLYDIANVLTSLGLIAKVDIPTNSMRKPVFEYRGPFVKMASRTSTHCMNLKEFISPSVPFEEDEGVENKIRLRCKRKSNKFMPGDPPEKFPRFSSESNLDATHGKYTGSFSLSARHVSTALHDGESRPNYKCSLDDILQVAGEELEKIRSNEELEAAQKVSSARKKLSFSRCHSDSCILPLNFKKEADQEILNPNHDSCINNHSESEMQPSIAGEKSVCITLSESKSKRFTITRKLVELPVNALPQKFTKESSLNIQNITPMQVRTLSNLFGIPTKQIRTGASKPDKLKADIVNNNKPVSQSVSKFVLGGGNARPLNCGTATSAMPPGELYRAIRIGNIVRLVPFITASKVKVNQQK